MASRSVLKAVRSEMLHRLSLQKFTTFNCTSKLFYCSEKLSESSEKTVTGFAKAFIKQSQIIDSPPQEESFARLLRKSKFVDLGDPVGKVVLGTIFRVVGNDLYIDFGWKFPTVCSKPQENDKLYVCGTKVKLLIKDLELSAKFLGADGETTLLEADCKLLGLAKAEKDNAKKCVDEIFD